MHTSEDGAGGAEPQGEGVDVGEDEGWAGGLKGDGSGEGQGSLRGGGSVAGGGRQRMSGGKQTPKQSVMSDEKAFIYHAFCIHGEGSWWL